MKPVDCFQGAQEWVHFIASFVSRACGGFARAMRVNCAASLKITYRSLGRNAATVGNLVDQNKPRLDQRLTLRSARLLTADYLISSERQLRLLVAGERMTRGDNDPW